jgi:hypothetical protein
MLVKVINQHNVAGYGAILRIDEPAAVGRDRQASTEPPVHFKDWPYLLTGEIEVLEGCGSLGRDKIDATRRKLYLDKA